MDIEIHALLSSIIEGVGVQLHMSIALIAVGKFK
jgi:hypothetical protein